MKNNRMETLKNNGVDTGRFFTILVNETIPAGTKINISIEGSEAIAQQIIEDGYVRNTKLHRRFVAAQYMRMLNSENGWHDYLNRNYGYMYQFDMMIEEVRVLKEIAKRDMNTFMERSQFFSHAVVMQVLEDYRKDMIKYIGELPKKKCKGQPYVYVKGYGNVFVSDVDNNVIAPINAAIARCKTCQNFNDLYDTLVVFKSRMIKLPYYTKKSKTWVDAFQKAGAFYTLKNLIMFHDVELAYGRVICTGSENSIEKLNELVKTYEGYKMHALLKNTIEVNHFDFAASIEAHS